ncbi:hypothetical protein RJ640_011619 [Escallonia rubra]|uniref:GrpE protein homolog n=1 Tax=Escallonia rubra TaxID=112253 RepID=A0AA88U274_9ASTE|nr:hypothetical protein RJ640_011619 [Escallonia rubra]
MATTVLRTPTFRAPPTPLNKDPFKSRNLVCASFAQNRVFPNVHFIKSSTPQRLSRRLSKFLPYGTYEETTETEEKVEVQESLAEILCFMAMEALIVVRLCGVEAGVRASDKSVMLPWLLPLIMVREPLSSSLPQEALDDADNAADVEDTGSKGESTDAEEPASATLASLQLYKEALANNDESRIAEIEALLISIEEETLLLESKVATFSEELSNEKARVLRISADFDNFRKRTERERLSLVTNARGEVVENLLPVLDNFERAKSQIKVATEGEEKINNSYQSIYKQFVEVLGALGVVPVETTGNPFDPLASLRVGSKFSQYLMSFFKRCLKFVQLHEAIMREDSAEYEEDVIIQEFRKGFKLGDRLLRPSMVKVSAGPGPAKPEPVEPEEPEGVSEVSDMGGAEPASSSDL